MKTTKKRRGISLTHFVDRPVVVCTNYYPDLQVLRSRSCKDGQYLIRSSSLPNQYRVSTPSKTRVSITYNNRQSQGGIPEPYLVRSTTRIVAAYPATQSVVLSKHDSKMMRNEAFGGSLTESKDIITRRLFTDESRFCQTDRLKTQNPCVLSGMAQDPEKNQSVYSSLFSFKQSQEGKKLRLQLKKDVVKFKVNKGSVQNEEDEDQYRLEVNKQSKLSTNAKSNLQEGSPAKNLENLKEIQIKLRDIVKACQERC